MSHKVGRALPGKRGRERRNYEIMGRTLHKRNQSAGTQF